MNFSSTVRAQMEGTLLGATALVEFEFVSETIRLWEGTGTLLTSDAKTWLGLDRLGSVDGISQIINGAAPLQTLTVSGVDEEFASRARGESSEYYRQPVRIYLQFFDTDWQTLDAPYAITYRQMDSMTISRSQGDEGPIYTVTIEAEGPFTTRKRPPFGFITDRDQKLRFPGDRGLERAAGIDGKRIKWPAW